jgi:hypothetical protein
MQDSPALGKQRGGKGPRTRKQRTRMRGDIHARRLAESQRKSYEDHSAFANVQRVDHVLRNLPKPKTRAES